MRDIILKITSKTVTQKDGEDSRENAIEFVTEGKLYGKGVSRLICYPESELSGLEGWTTFLTIKGGRIKMKRSNGTASPETVMEFEQGRRFEGHYQTPYGILGMEVLTNRITPLVENLDGTGSLTIDYSVSLKGFMESRNELAIEFRNKN